MLGLCWVSWPGWGQPPVPTAAGVQPWEGGVVGALPGTATPGGPGRRGLSVLRCITSLPQALPAVLTTGQGEFAGGGRATAALTQR